MKLTVAALTIAVLSLSLPSCGTKQSSSLAEDGDKDVSESGISSVEELKAILKGNSRDLVAARTAWLKAKDALFQKIKGKLQDAKSYHGFARQLGSLKFTGEKILYAMVRAPVDEGTELRFEDRIDMTNERDVATLALQQPIFIALDFNENGKVDPNEVITLVGFRGPLNYEFYDFDGDNIFEIMHRTNDNVKEDDLWLRMPKVPADLIKAYTMSAFFDLTPSAVKELGLER